MCTESGGSRRDHLRALAQRVEVDAKEVRIMGSKGVLLRTLVAASRAKSAMFGVCFEIGALGEIRTPDPRIRSPMLYPAELRAQFRMPRISELFAQFYGGANRNIWRTFAEGCLLVACVQGPGPGFCPNRDA